MFIINNKKHEKNNQVAFTPWSMKAWMGCMSDLLPLFGYHVNIYITIMFLLFFLGGGEGRGDGEREKKHSGTKKKK